MTIRKACVCTAILLLTASAPAHSEELEERGRVLVTRLCGQCHAVGPSGSSPHPAAPPFRRLGDRVDLDTFNERLREGLFAGHSDMPQFRMSREEARAVRAYLRSIQGR